LGILCTSLLHGALFPRTLTRQLQIRADQVLADTERWLTDPTKRPQLLLEINELLTLSLQLPFDTAREMPSCAVVDAFRDRLTTLLRLGPSREVLSEAHALRDQIQHPGYSPIPPELLAIRTHSAPARNYASSAWIGLGAAIAVAVASAFWILTAWPSGSTLAIYVGVQCALFGGLPQGDRAVVKFLCGAASGIVAGLLYAYTVLPRVSDPVLLAVTTAPILLVIGSVLGRPSTAVQGVSASVGFLSEVGFAATYNPDFAFSVNDSIALLGGVGASVLMIRLFQLHHDR